VAEEQKGQTEGSAQLEVRARPNRLGLWGWLGGGRWGFERYLYTLHRISGLALLAYFLLHILVTSARAFGQGAWESAMRGVSGTAFHIGEYLVFAAFAFHAINGIRLILVELGFGIGRPIEPIYPYRTSLHAQRWLAVSAMVIAAVIALVGGYDFFLMGHH